MKVSGIFVTFRNNFDYYRPITDISILLVSSAMISSPIFLESLTAGNLADISQSFRVLPVELKTKLSLPKFRFEQSHEMGEILRELGITNLFEKVSKY